MPIEMQKNIYHERDNYSADQAPSATAEVSYQMGQERDKAVQSCLNIRYFWAKYCPS